MMKQWIIEFKASGKRTTLLTSVECGISIYHWFWYGIQIFLCRGAAAMDPCVRVSTHIHWHIRFRSKTHKAYSTRIENSWFRVYSCLWLDGKSEVNPYQQVWLHQWPEDNFDTSQNTCWGHFCARNMRMLDVRLYQDLNQFFKVGGQHLYHSMLLWMT